VVVFPVPLMTGGATVRLSIVVTPVGAVGAVGAVPADADSVHVMIRPEYVEVSTGDKAEGVSAHITEVEFIGQVTALTIDVGGTILRAITLSRPDVTMVPDAPCKVRIADRNIVVMPDQTV